jgi:hypothetical protein
VKNSIDLAHDSNDLALAALLSPPRAYSRPMFRLIACGRQTEWPNCLPFVELKLWSEMGGNLGNDGQNG